jgi:predicted enzyme related to lactoylglutathione lyase
VVRLDHLAIDVRDWTASRDWYVANLGMKIEFEIAERKTVALQDDAGLTLFAVQTDAPPAVASVFLTFQVDDVDAKYAELSRRGVAFLHPPQKLYWGYGAELLDPSGYRIGLWDQTTMREKGG